MSKDKLLMIVNEFPPTGASSVQRPLKFAKYAVKAGWEVQIIPCYKKFLLKQKYTELLVWASKIPKKTKW